MSETVGNKTNFKIFWCVRNWKINLKETGWRKLNLEHRCFGRVRNTLMKINEKNFGCDRNILKKINEENFGRVKYSMIIFPPFLDLTGETLWIFFACEKFELLSDQGCFENVSELFFEVKVEINYDFEVKKFMSWLEIKMFFKMRHNPHLYLLKITKKWKSVSKYTHLWTFKSHHTPPYWCAPLAELSSDESLTMNHGTQYKPAKG